MNFPDRRTVLIVDSEYLIAMDAARLLTNATSCEVTIATPTTYAQFLENRAFDIALIDTGSNPDGIKGIVEDAGRRNVFIVLTTTFREYARGVPGFETLPVVLKPYDEHELVDLIGSIGVDSLSLRLAI